MLSVVSLLVALALSLLVTRIATLALVHTGLSRETAKFQARSAFSGSGFTTSEAEAVVNHPVRRRIVMLLMLLGSAGIITVVSSLIITFVQPSQPGDWPLRLLVLFGGLGLLWVLAVSPWVDRYLSRAINWALAALPTSTCTTMRGFCT